MCVRRQLTLSSLPKSRWQNLPILDLIKERNKPKEAPKAPAAPSFFLSTTQGLNPQLNPFADKALMGGGGDEKKDDKGSEGAPSCTASPRPRTTQKAL